MKSLFFPFFLILTLSQVWASGTDLQRTFETLSKNPTWLNLLYIDPDTGESEVVSTDYFLSDRGRYDPLSELEATVAAYAEPFGENPNDHSVCRFPARYHWLSQHIQLADYQTARPECSRLRQSLEQTRIHSVSLMFVSGFLGNPASSFGHSFLKLNDRSVASETDLFDLAISYGADVPENENMFVYMYSGLFGLYTARFTDKYFYTQDLVYSSNEFRDIWEYELNLSAAQVTFLQLHLWEILGKKFRYLFLNRNCGYEISRLIEVVLDANLTQHAKLWFVPAETFHSLAETDNARYIKQIIYHPSEQKVVYERYAKLTYAEREAATALIHARMDVSNPLYAALGEREKINTINFILAYYKYLLVKDHTNSTWKTLKQKALVERFELPAEREDAATFDRAISPDRTDKPTLLFSNVNILEDQPDSITLGYAPYALQSIGRNNLNGNELVVMQGEAGITSEKIYLSSFDLLRIKRFDRYGIPLDDEHTLSWQLDIAAKNIDIERDAYDVYAEGGIGKTWSPLEGIMAYFMLNLSLHSHDDTAEITPEIGSRIVAGPTKAMLTIKNRFALRSNVSLVTTTLKTLTGVSNDFAFYTAFKYENSYELSAGLQFYFY